MECKNKNENIEFASIKSALIRLTSLRRSLELSASRGATDDVVNRSDARPLSSDVPGSFAIVNVFCNE